MLGNVVPLAGVITKFCKTAVVNKNIVFRANVSPAQSRLPCKQNNSIIY